MGVVIRSTPRLIALYHQQRAARLLRHAPLHTLSFQYLCACFKVTYAVNRWERKYEKCSADKCRKSRLISYTKLASHFTATQLTPIKPTICKRQLSATFSTKTPPLDVCSSTLWLSQCCRASESRESFITYAVSLFVVWQFCNNTVFHQNHLLIGILYWRKL